MDKIIKELTEKEKDEIIAEHLGEYYKGDIVLYKMIDEIIKKIQNLK